ncbi:MAG: DinB family protein [Acetobacteraceae bacterium]|nr:damage-inducible protein DinB [Pseudomonadota bacterium]
MENFRFMSRFNQWVNSRLYAVVGQLPEEQYRREMGAFFGSIERTLNHLMIVDRMWISRFTGDNTDDIQTARDILHPTFPGLLKAREAMDLYITATVDRLRGEDMDRSYTFVYKTSGTEGTMFGRHMLLAMFNHQTHHRGQVHCMLTQLGYEIPGLDVPPYVRDHPPSSARLYT